jgi:hypothetical protein
MAHRVITRVSLWWAGAAGRVCGLSTVRLSKWKSKNNVLTCHPYEHYLVTYSLVFVIGGPAGCGWVLREMDEYGAISRVSNCTA